MDGRSLRVLFVCNAFFAVLLLASGCVRSKPTQTTIPLGQTPTNSAPATQDTQSAESIASPTAAKAYPGPTVTLDPNLPTAAPLLPATPTISVTVTSLAPTATEPPPTIVPTAITTPTLTPTPTLLPQNDVTYTVAKGDTLLSIAERYETTVQAIVNKNGLLNPNRIYPGQEIVIPVGYEPSETPMPKTIEHTVTAGETLSQLARQYGTTVDAILAENTDISDPNTLSQGVVLTITTGTAPLVLTHTVGRGENLYGIARMYGVSFQALVQANGLANPNRLLVGQVLVIP